MSRRSAQLLVFSTSAAVLVLEILAGRLMAPYVGVSIETFTGIIGTILAGIALGNYVGGRLADSIPPRKALGPALIVGGLLSWASLPIVSAVGPTATNEAPAIVFLAFVSFFAPAAVLSTVSPLVAKLAVTDLGSTGTVVGGLSGAGTLGALAGTFVTGFVLVATVPTRATVIAVGAGLVVAGVALTVRGSLSVAQMATWGGVGALALAGAIWSNDRCDFESAYACGSVEVDSDDPSVRLLRLNQASHARVDLDDPTSLEFRYIRLIAASIDARAPGALDALHIGGGGFTLPRYIEAVRPGSYNLVLEIDAELVDVAEAELGLVRSERLVVQVGDARTAVGDLDADAFDVIVGDAFTGASVPWHLTTREFVAELDRVLRDDGQYVMNVIDGDSNRFARAMAATLAERFEHVEVVGPPGGLGTTPRNQILIASHRPIPRFAIDPEDGEWWPNGPSAFISGQSPLRDDHAPADQLATR